MALSAVARTTVTMKGSMVEDLTNGSALQLSATLSRGHVALQEDGSEPLGALVTIRAGSNEAPAVPVELCLILDASGSMHRFCLDPEQRELWRRVAERRGDLIQDTADGREGWLWSGETLREMQGLIQTPMMAVIRGLAAVAQRMAPEDRLTVIAFADAAEVLLDRATADERQEGLSGVIDRLTRGMDDSGLGRGTRLAEALKATRQIVARQGDRAGRVLILSDGVVEEGDACLREVEAIADIGTPISTIGVGEEFDEELLMRIADDARGRYTYSPSATEIESVLGEEVVTLARLAARGLWLTIQPEAEVVFRELFQVAPAVSRFNSVWMEDGSYRYRLGDLARGETLQLLAEFALPPAAPGANAVAAVHVAAEEGSAAVALAVTGTAEAEKLWDREESAVGAMEAVQAYLGERRAHQAAADGDIDGATRHLRQTTRILRHMGQLTLASDTEALAADLEAGRTLSLHRTKQLKAATRRLGGSSPLADAARHDDPIPHDFVHDRNGGPPERIV
jgi:Ca-activated chloride channel family protein